MVAAALVPLNQQNTALAQKHGQRCDEGMAHVEMGKRLNDYKLLQRAMAIFADLGAEWDLARAREALAETRQSGL